MFGLKLTRLIGALAVGSMCASSLVASCTTPDFKFADEPSATPSHCTNSERDEGESDVDCGGTCTPCALTQRCNTSADCRDAECTDGTCQAAGCGDQAQSGTETDVDCGGGACKPCAATQACEKASDCSDGVCTGKRCAEASCGDRVQNGDETDVDCGGTACSACIPGQGCLTPSDCVGNDCTAGKCAQSCAAGTGNCDGNATNGCETNLRTDAEHCGDCSTVCSLSNASSSCQAGACRVASCTAPFDDCNGDPKDGCEVNTKTDVDNCGACAAKPCPTLNGKAYCADSTCGITCTENFADCDGQGGNGCEKDVSRDVNNCGACGKQCTAGAGKTPWCRNGQCGETTCAAGRGDCNGDPDDDAAHGGCETDFKTDIDSCGSCGNACAIAGGDAQCSSGTCAIKKCNAGLADCVGGYADGCETNTNTDIANCGVCGKTCNAPGGTPECVSGACDIKTCTGALADCNGVLTDGCEINTATSQTHCGACTGDNTNCNGIFANATAHCANSACVFDGCGTDQANCDTVLSNGCEVNLKTDKNHCGNCSTACATTGASSTSCSAGACAPLCTGTRLACSTPQNGCTVDAATDANNCGGCGKVCATGSAAHVTANTCGGSVCKPSCASNYADCDSIPQNGCELSVANDKNNCGGCNVVCGTAHTVSTNCSAGACAPNCSAGWKNCGAPADGCNVQLGTTANCTKCGESCSGATPYCTAGGCSGHLDIAVSGSVTTAAASFDGSGVPILTKTHLLTNPSGSSRVVLVGVTAAEPYLITESVKYNGVSMIPAVQAKTNEGHSYAGIFYLLDAALPVNPASYLVQVTLNTNMYAGVGTVDVVEFKNVAQTGTFVATPSNATDTDCNTSLDRSLSLGFSQPGSFAYAVTGARTGNSVTPAPNFTTTMNLAPTSPWPLAGVAGYVGPINSTFTFSWNIMNCWNSASVGVVLKRVGD